MKGAFIHDNIFLEKDNYVFDTSGGIFAQYLWARYLKICENLVVVGRRVESWPMTTTLSSTPKVEFELITDLKKPLDRFIKKKKIQAKLKEIFKEIDFVIIRIPSSLGYMAYQICRKEGIPYVLEVVGDPFQSYWNHGSVKGKFIALHEARKMKNVTKSAKNVIYVTKEQLQNKYPTRGNSEAVSNVYLTEVNTRTKVKEFYEKYSETFKIGLIGTFQVGYKGHKEALFALKELLQANFEKKVKLYMVGSGDASWVRDLIERLSLQEQVIVVGALEAAENGIIPFIDTLDLLIHPSKTEGLPRVVIEGLSRGKVCLASDVGGIPELLSPEFLHPPGNWKILSRQITKILELKPPQLQEIGFNNLEIARQYLEPNLQKKREKFIFKIINQNNKI